MIPAARSLFNDSFTEEKYSSFMKELNDYAGKPIPFRIAETPVFIPAEFKAKLVEACNSIIHTIKDPQYLKESERAIPNGLFVPGNESKPLWLAFDFAVCKDANDELVPMLIEMQGFPSLFYYQHLLGISYRKYFNVADNVNHLFGMNNEQYIEHMNKLLLNGYDSKNVILLELEPEKQNTEIDFIATCKSTGIKAVCISKVIRDGRKLFYLDNNIKTEIKRIYNRVIFDEFSKRTDLKCQFNLTEDVDVEWAGHPNWFFRISKFTMPFLESRYVPKTHFLNEINEIPADLENYVLKPLFSFSGSGVIFNVKREDIDTIADKENWILQEKVNYEPVIASPDGKVKTEIRMLYSWTPEDENPRLVINMARLSKGEMIGVKYNLNKTWVGGSVGYFEI